jgi:hypothetical protein
VGKQLKMHEEERAFQAQQLKKQLDFQEPQLNLQREMLKRHDVERKEKYSTVSQLKLWGDALRNSIIRMPTSEAVDLIPFFEHAERLFCDLEVSNTLRIQLLRPHLSDNVRMLLTRLDPKQATDYAFVKQYLLHQFRLLPRTFLDRFNSVVRQADETMTLFATRLRNLLEYYLESRHVDRDYDRFVSLIVADHLKSTLSEQCLHFVLSVEQKYDRGWLEEDKLATTVDDYLSNHRNDKPAAHPIGFSNKTPEEVRNPGATWSQNTNFLTLGKFCLPTKTESKAPTKN